MSKVVFPGSFDPITNGHLNIIERASKIFDEVDVVVAQNEEKKYLFTSEERLNFVEDSVKNLKNVKVHLWNGLIVEYAKKNGADVIVRGVRNLADFSYEFELSLANRTINSEIETIFIPTEQKYLLLKSSMVKEFARLGVDITQMVSPMVKQCLLDKIK